MSITDDDMPLSSIASKEKRFREDDSSQPHDSRLKRRKHLSRSSYAENVPADSQTRSSSRGETASDAAMLVTSAIDEGDDDMDDTPLSVVRKKRSPVVKREQNIKLEPRAGSNEQASRLAVARERDHLKSGNGANGRRELSNGKRHDMKLAESEVVPFRPNAKKEDCTAVISANDNDSVFGDGEEGGEWETPRANNSAIKWRTLSHNAVMFPPEYEPHGVPLLYNGEPVPLIASCEEIATFYAAKLGTDYVTKATFNENFFKDFRFALKRTPAYQTVKSLGKCDFTRIKAHLDKKRDEKKELSAAEKKAVRETEAEKTKKYLFATVDGRQEKVGNFRVEPPALFLGRGEHPRMGQVKARIYPEDVTINIGKEAPIPEVPIAGHKWGGIVHDNKVTWLAGWKDSITGGRKYVFLSDGSQFKSDSDRKKFEKARALGRNIAAIRRDYREGWSSKSKLVRQRSVAMYLIDKLALRVGNEKNEDEADTVGCCSLRVEHIKLIEPRTVEFDFLGKDSMRYHNTVEVELPVFLNFRLFVKGKAGGDDVFHRLTTTILNDYLKSLMPGLSAKVFRTYNASVTLDRLLRSTPEEMSAVDKIVYYNQQNKEVAILCNHQRSAPKTHEAQMSKLEKRIEETQQWLTELNKAARKFKSARKKSAELDSVSVVEFKREKPEFTGDMDDKARAEERKRAAEAPRIKTERTMNMSQVTNHIARSKEKLEKLRADHTVKNDLKTVALGTSKINYLDPRITVAWCKKYDVPVERIFAATLLVKFAWAMPIPSTYTF